MKRLEGKVALVTGAASGIGAACAERFAAEGARVAGVDVAGEPGKAWRNPERLYCQADVRDEKALAAAVRDTLEHFGQLDVAVAAAGVSSAGNVTDLDPAEWDRVLDINLKGSFLTARHAIAAMRPRRSGSVILISSIEGIIAFPMQAAYNASKGGVILLTRNMALDYGPEGIRVNCICPGYIETPMTAPLREMAELRPLHDRFVAQTPLGRAGRPEEIAAVALFLASDDAAFVTGHALVADGGFTAGMRMVDAQETISEAAGRSFSGSGS